MDSYGDSIEDPGTFTMPNSETVEGFYTAGPMGIYDELVASANGVRIPILGQIPVPGPDVWNDITLEQPHTMDPLNATAFHPNVTFPQGLDNHTPLSHSFDTSPCDPASPEGSTSDDFQPNFEVTGSGLMEIFGTTIYDDTPLGAPAHQTQPSNPDTTPRISPSSSAPMEATKASTRPETTRTYFECNIGNCKERKFKKQQSRLTHARKAHEKFFCNFPECPQADDYTQFQEKSDLDKHWNIAHKYEKRFRCVVPNCWYTTDNHTNMKNNHLLKVHSAEDLNKLLDAIKEEKKNRNG